MAVKPLDRTRGPTLNSAGQQQMTADVQNRILFLNRLRSLSWRRHDISALRAQTSRPLISTTARLIICQRYDPNAITNASLSIEEGIFGAFRNAHRVDRGLGPSLLFSYTRSRSWRHLRMHSDKRPG